jgi:hypothetical protein
VMPHISGRGEAALHLLVMRPHVQRSMPSMLAFGHRCARSAQPVTNYEEVET